MRSDQKGDKGDMRQIQWMRMKYDYARWYCKERTRKKKKKELNHRISEQISSTENCLLSFSLSVVAPDFFPLP